MPVKYFDKVPREDVCRDYDPDEYKWHGQPSCFHGYVANHLLKPVHCMWGKGVPCEPYPSVKHPDRN